MTDKLPDVLLLLALAVSALWTASVLTISFSRMGGGRNPNYDSHFGPVFIIAVVLWFAWVVVR